MANQPVLVGTVANDKTGDPLRTAYQKINANFLETYSGSAKFWAKYGVSGNVLASYNVTSVTDVGIGQSSVVINVDFASPNWAATAAIENGAFQGITISSMTAGTIAFICWNSTFGIADPVSYSVAGFGVQ